MTALAVPAATATALDQRRAPLAEAIADYVDRGTWAFHVPGHKRGGAADPRLRGIAGDTVLSHDVWLETGAYDRARREAEDLAAAAWGADRAHLLGNGSTSGNLAFLLATLREGDEVVLSRDVHTSTLTALVMTGARPVWVLPRLHPVADIGTGVAAEDVAEALRRHPAARLVAVVSPSYAGVCSDTVGIVAAAHAAGAMAYVDEAWGAHLAFSPDLPEHAMAVGADGAVTSVHKTLPAMSSGSLLLNAAGVDGDRLASTVRMTQTTSPFLPLLASVDLARRAAALDGPALVERAVGLAAEVRRRLRRVRGLRVPDHTDLGLPAARLDPLKLVVDVSGLGLTGLDAETALRDRLGIAPEGADLTSVYLVVAPGDSTASVEAVVGAFDALAATAAGPRMLPRQRDPRSTGAVLRTGPQVMTPREAFQSASREVPLREAVGEVCAEIVTPYPPGIPVLVPGEALTSDVVAYLADAVARGVHVHGAADAALATVRVVA